MYTLISAIRSVNSLAGGTCPNTIDIGPDHFHSAAHHNDPMRHHSCLTICLSIVHQNQIHFFDPTAHGTHGQTFDFMFARFHQLSFSLVRSFFSRRPRRSALFTKEAFRSRISIKISEISGVNSECSSGDSRPRPHPSATN